MWNDTKNAEPDILDGDLLEPTSLQVVPSDADTLTPLVRAAQVLGKRDVGAMKKEAAKLGALMGRSAFYSFPAGGGQVEGATIKLAYALATMWGRMQTRAILVSKDGSRVTLRGVAIDILTLTSVERDHHFTLSPPPGKFAKKPDQADRWQAMQLQAAMSKAVRSAILSCIPEDIVLTAVEAAQAASSSKLFEWLGVAKMRDGITEAQNRAKHIGLTVDETEVIAGSPVAEWGMDELDKVCIVVKRVADGVTPLERVKAHAAKLRAESAKAITEVKAPWRNANGTSAASDEPEPAHAEEAKQAPPPEDKAQRAAKPRGKAQAELMPSDDDGDRPDPFGEG